MSRGSPTIVCPWGPWTARTSTSRGCSSRSSRRNPEHDRKRTGPRGDELAGARSVQGQEAGGAASRGGGPRLLRTGGPSAQVEGLIVPPVARPLDEVCPIRCTRTAHVQALAAVLGNDAVAASPVLHIEPLVVATMTSPLNDGGTIVRARTTDIHALS